MEFLRQILLISLITFLCSCSQQKTPAHLKITSQFAVGANGFTGGLFVIGSNGTQKFSGTATSGTSFKVTLEEGTWKFIVVGWDGATSFAGSAYCGVKTHALSSASPTVSIDVSTANCTGSDFIHGAPSSLKSLKLYTCGDLKGSDLNPITLSTSPASLFNTLFCDDNSGLAGSQKDTARAVKISLPATLGAGTIESNCIATAENPLDIGKLPLRTLPFTFKLYDMANCSGPSKVYSFPDGVQNGLNSDVVMNLNDTGFNSLFLQFNYLIQPLNITINQATGQNDPALALPIYFDVVFSHAIDPSTWSPADISNGGTATGVVWNAINSGDNKHFTLTAISMATAGTITPHIAASLVGDAYGTMNTASTGTDNTVSYTPPPLTVTIDQSGAQPDPATGTPIIFDIVFSHAVNPLTFTNSDVSNTGSATGVVWTVTNTGDNTHFTLTVATIGAGGTVIPHITASMVGDDSGVFNTASTSTSDGQVLYQPIITSSPATQIMSNTVLGSASKAETITFTNSSGAMLTGCAAATLTGTGASDFDIYEDSCTAPTMSMGTSCSVLVRMKPGTTGAKTVTVSRTCSEAKFTTSTNGVYGNAIKGFEAESAVSDFGKVKIGKSTNPMYVHFKNTSNVAFTTCSAPTIDNATDFTIVDNCTTTAQTAYTSCDVTVKANPTGVGVKIANVSRICDGVTATKTLMATGDTLNIAELRAGGDVTCLTMSDNTLRCAGFGNHGQLTNGGRSNQMIPYITSLTNVSQNYVGEHHSCAVLINGDIKCWGHGYDGELGHGLSGGSASQQTTPVTVSTLTNPLMLSLGKTFTCALDVYGAVQCWGLNLAGNFGVASPTSSSVPVAGPVGPYSSISAGDDSVCVVTPSTTVECWGANTHGQLGDSSYTPSSSPVSVSSLSMVDQIVSGEGFHCALSNGGVQCWGKNNFGQLGDGTTTNSNVPVTTISFGVAALAKTDSGSSRHMCAIMTSGNVKCWGQNNYQQIGTGSPTGPQITPYQVNSLSNVDKLTIGRRHSCARTSTGEVVCWGSNSDGQLGKGYKNSTLPIQIQSATSVAKVVVGKDVTCYRNFSNTVSCFGSNRANELGNTTGEDVTGPFVNVSGTYTDLFASGDYMGLQICGKAISTGQVFCWGRSDIGPTAYTGLDTATYISGGNAHLCGVFGAGFASCGGSNTYGQLGLGYTSASETHSSQTLVPNTITSIAGGFGTTYTVHSDGSAYSWGYGTSGALGNGSTSHLATPAYQLPLTNVTKIIGAYTAACAVHDSGKLSCWGTGDLGVVGGVSNIPQRVSTLDGVSSLASGYRHVCALKSGTVWCWGGGMGEGETGTGSVMSNTVPKPVMNLQGVTSLWRGENAGSHSCAVKSDNTLWCWGNADVFIAPWGNEYMSGYAP